MRIHEYQAKEILRSFGVRVPEGVIIDHADEASNACKGVKGPPWVVKAQVHAGARGKGGGIIVCCDANEVLEAAKAMLGRSLVTVQTGSEGVKVRKVLIEECIDIFSEFYLGVVIDRAHAKPAMIFCPAGGMEIEEVTAVKPELIWKEYIYSGIGLMPFQTRNLVYQLDRLTSGDSIKKLRSVMSSMWSVFSSCDCSLLEINPLALTTGGEFIALDAKMNLDDNALYRQRKMFELDAGVEKDPSEAIADAYDLNYIRLNGSIGVMVNGAGLAMATMDLIKAAGGEPANFLDVGGGANEEKITKAFEIILKDRRVKAILVNIFGGILRCDVLARGVVSAAEKNGVGVPLIVRLEGTNVAEGKKIFEESGVEFLVAQNLLEAAELVARQVSGEN